MIVWKVEFKPSADREFRKLPRDAQDKIRASLRHLATTGLGDVTAMKGNQAGKFRLRVGDYRLIFRRETRDDASEGKQEILFVILVLHVGNRRDVYKH